MTDSLTQIQSVCQNALALADKATPGPWTIAPMEGTQKIVQSAGPFICNTLHGNDADNADFIAHSRTLLPALATALQEAADYINGFTTCDGEDCDCRHHTSAKSVLSRISEALKTVQP